LTSVPVLLIGDQKLLGFNPSEIEAALTALRRCVEGAQREA